MTKGKSIRLFLVDGTPGGMITAEIINWTGHVLVAPRSRLPDLLQREEAARGGLYVLLGEKSDGDEKVAYIGETESIKDRLKQHARPEESGGKDFWTRVFIITSKDANLTKSHLKFVESRLINVALAANRINLENISGTVGEYGLLPEADRSDMLEFIENIQMVMPVLGLDLWRATPKPTAKGAQESVNSPEFVLISQKTGLSAKAQEIDGEFVVQAGSIARTNWTEKNWNNGYKKLHEHLQQIGILVPESEGVLRFAKEYVFSSPSAASAVIMGRADNGRKSWRTSDGTSYGEWQSKQLEALPVT